MEIGEYDWISVVEGKEKQIRWRDRTSARITIGSSKTGLGMKPVSEESSKG